MRNPKKEKKQPQMRREHSRTYKSDWQKKTTQSNDYNLKHRCFARWNYPH